VALNHRHTVFRSSDTLRSLRSQELGERNFIYSGKVCLYFGQIRGKLISLQVKSLRIPLVCRYVTHIFVWRAIIKLHIGGEITKDGWQILNISKKPGVDFIGDINDLSMFKDGSTSDVYASHVFEHVKQAEALDTLKGIQRILKPRGKFYVSVPDLDVLCHTFINPIVSPDVKFHVMRMMFGGQIDAYDFHFFGWNQAFLFDFLRQAGFSGAKRVESFGLFNDTSDYKPYGFPISLNVIATK
jgi:predicted SAM-dependent methyltransferase